MIEKSVFRIKSLKRATSPDELDDYIRVVNPSVWVLLAAIVVFLAGVIIWAATTSVDGASLLSFVWN